MLIELHTRYSSAIDIANGGYYYVRTYSFNTDTESIESTQPILVYGYNFPPLSIAHTDGEIHAFCIENSPTHSRRIFTYYRPGEDSVEGDDYSSVATEDVPYHPECFSQQVGVVTALNITASCISSGNGRINLTATTTSTPTAAGYEITVELLSNNSVFITPTAPKITQSTGPVEFSGLPDGSYTINLRDQAGAVASYPGIQVNCTQQSSQLEIYDIVRVDAREDGTVLGSADVFARPVAGGAIDVAVEGHLGDSNWTPFYNHGSFVSHRFDNLTAGNYTVTLRVSDGQPNLTQNFTIGSFVAPVQLGDQLSFLPWVRHKLSRTAGPAGGSLRPVLPLQLTLAVEGGGALIEQVTVPLELYGPGDVVGLTPAAVLRTTPRPDIQNFSPLQLASIEFQEEDLPWRYSPEAIADTHQLRPWCFLLVLEEDEFTLLPQGAAPLPGITVKAGVPLPHFDQLPLLAHVQVNRVLGTSAQDVEDFLAGPLQQNPALAFSRLFSPRRLKENTGYVAFLLPTYETGRRAGLGQPMQDGSGPSVAADTAAWPDAASGSTAPRAFPVYHQWRFQTGTDSDFESLAQRLQPASAALPLAGNQLRVSTPLGSASGGSSGDYLLGLPGVLEPLGTTDPALSPLVAESVYQALEPGFVPGRVGSGGRPVVAPPLYGRAYMNSPVLGSPASGNALAAWPEQANLDPRYRVVAALGSELVQEQQQEYVQRAWDQVQDVLVANLNLRGLQFGLETSAALRRQNLPGAFGEAAPITGDASRAARSSSLVAEAVVPENTLANYGLQLTALALPRVRLAATGLSARETIRRSSVPLAAFSPTFRLLLRPFGPYQVNLAGRPLRPTQVPAPDTPADPLGPGTSLRQRDELLSRLATGQLRATAPKSQLIRAYQFDDAALNGLLADASATPTLLRVLSEDGSQQVQSITDAGILAEFGAAFTDLRTQTRFRTVDPPLPRLDLETLKTGMVAGTDPERVLPSRAQQGLTTVPKFITGDFETADFAAEDFLVDEVIAGVTVEPSLPLPASRESLRKVDGPLAESLTIGQAMGEEALRTAPEEIILRETAVFESPIKPVKVSPVFPDALGEQLRRRHPELLLPGLADFPADTVALLQINRAFIEAYLLGANHALGSELRWRGFPVDLRASYFRQFWDVSDYRNTLPVAVATPAALAEREELLRDVAPLHTWAGRALGANPGPGPGAQVVMVIRAELLHRFPNTVICAQPAKPVEGTSEFGPDQTAALTRYPVYRLPIGQDLVALAFELTPAEATGTDPAQPGGYFFCFLERPGEPQFGLDAGTSPATNPDGTEQELNSWNDLSWTYLGVDPGDNLVISPTGRPSVIAGPVQHLTNSAELAYALFQQPVMVAIPAQQLLG